MTYYPHAHLARVIIASCMIFAGIMAVAMAIGVLFYHTRLPNITRRVVRVLGPSREGAGRYILFGIATVAMGIAVLIT